MTIMGSTPFGAQVLRAVIQALIAEGEPDIASMLIEAEVTEDRDSYGNTSLLVSVPAEFYAAIMEKGNSIMDFFRTATHGHFFDDDGRPTGAGVVFRTLLKEVEPDWVEVVKAQIAQAKATNQGLVTSTVFGRRGQDPVMYGELRFGSKTEVRIAQELESRKVMFFPLAVAVKAETGVYHKDHREVDFLVIQAGVVGILEVAGPNHNGRQVADIEKDEWFQSAGIICLKAYPAELCWADPSGVVDAFLKYLALHAR